MRYLLTYDFDGKRHTVTEKIDDNKALTSALKKHRITAEQIARLKSEVGNYSYGALVTTIDGAVCELQLQQIGGDQYR